MIGGSKTKTVNTADIARYGMIVEIVQGQGTTIVVIYQLKNIKDALAGNMINYIEMSEICQTCDLDCEKAWEDGTCMIVDSEEKDASIDEVV